MNTSAQAGIEQAYDALPFVSLSCRESHPVGLEALARLFGFGPAPASSCRVLEIGCGTGVNLLAMAETLPASRFVGFDLSGVQIGLGRKMASAAGLENVQLEQLDLCNTPDGLGEFDYILCNGVYSWVPEPVQASLLKTVRRHLAPDGLAFVSYNTMPGWFSRSVIRSMMLFHVGDFEQPREKVQQSRQLLEFLAQSAPAGEPHYRAALQREAMLLRECPDEYIFHELLSASNFPVWFHQFVAGVEQNGLAYFGDANISSMWNGNRTERVNQTLQQLSDDFVTREQYLDFVLNRTFRRSLLCRADKTFSRSIHTSAIREGFLFTSLEPDPPLDLAASGPVEVRLPCGSGQLRIDDLATRAVLKVVCSRGERGLPLCEVVEASAAGMQRAGVNVPSEAKHRDDVASAAIQLVLSGLVELEFQPAPFAFQIDDRPRVSPLARILAQQQRFVVNRRHQSVVLDPFTRQVASLLDGKTGLDAVADIVRQRIDAGAVQLPADFAGVSINETVRDSLERLSANLFLTG
jgi:SAM-dependent methyltransferase